MRASFRAFAILFAMSALRTSAGFIASRPATNLQLQLSNGVGKKFVPAPGVVPRQQRAVLGGLEMVLNRNWLPDMPGRGLSRFKIDMLGKRYWLWKISEWCLDRILDLAQAVTIVIYRILARMFESPYDESRLKAIRRRLTELQASEPGSSFSVMDVVWEVGAADEVMKAPGDVGKDGEAASLNAGADNLVSSLIASADEVDISLPSLALHDGVIVMLSAIPLVLQAIGILYDEPYYKAVANASVWLALCALFVDWAAGSPGFPRLKKVLPHAYDSPPERLPAKPSSDRTFASR